MSCWSAASTADGGFPTLRPMTPLALSAYTLTTCLGRGIDATREALRAERSALAPCTFETVRLDTWIGEVAGVDRRDDGSADGGCELVGRHVVEQQPGGALDLHGARHRRTAAARRPHERLRRPSRGLPRLRSRHHTTGRSGARIAGARLHRTPSLRRVPARTPGRGHRRESGAAAGRPRPRRRTRAADRRRDAAPCPAWRAAGRGRRARGRQHAHHA